MELRNPPLVQVWIELTFEKSSEIVWEPKVIEKLFSQFQEEYPVWEATWDNRITIEKSKPNKLPRVIDERPVLKIARALTQDRSRSVQVSHNQLVCNFTRTGESYPGFEALCNETLKRLEEYLRCCCPESLTGLALHYVDVIEIPIDGQPVRLEDYFEPAIGYPAGAFGVVSSFLVSCTAHPDNAEGPLQIRFASEPTDPELQLLRYQIDWHLSRQKGLSLEVDEVRRSLTAMHDCLIDYFQKSFTAKGWELFEPLETEQRGEEP